MDDAARIKAAVEALAFIALERGETFLDDSAWQEIHKATDGKHSPRDINLRLLRLVSAAPPIYSVEYDATTHSLIATERLSATEYGAASLIGHGIPPEFGPRIAAALSEEWR